MLNNTFAIESLKDPNEAAAYLNAALEKGDSQLFLVAIRNVATAYGGITTLLEKAKLNQENLYQMLSQAENQKLHDLSTLLDTLGLKLTIAVKEPESVY